MCSTIISMHSEFPTDQFLELFHNAQEELRVMKEDVRAKIEEKEQDVKEAEEIYAKNLMLFSQLFEVLTVPK